MTIRHRSRSLIELAKIAISISFFDRSAILISIFWISSATFSVFFFEAEDRIEAKEEYIWKSERKFEGEEEEKTSRLEEGRKKKMKRWKLGRGRRLRKGGEIENQKLRYNVTCILHRFD